MSELTVQDGTLVVKNGTLGTGPECCCGGGGAECTTTIDMGCKNVDDPPPACPDGFQGPFEASSSQCFICTKTTTVADCNECVSTKVACYEVVNGQFLRFISSADDCDGCPDPGFCSPYSVFCNPLP